MTIQLAPAEPTSPAPVQNNEPGPEAAVIEPMHPRLFSADPLSGEDLERHLVAKSNHRLQGLAQRVAAARSRLVDMTAAASVVSAAEEARHFQGADPEAWLLDELAAIQAQIAQAEAGRKRADARWLARSKRITPLHSAVGMAHAKLLAERDRLADDRSLIKKNLGMPVAGQHQRLLDAGLTLEQIASLGGVVAPDERRRQDVQRIDARLAEIEPQITALEAWHASGKRDHQHLAGLGFDDLIKSAQPVGEEVAP